jgi:excisionase family DNA binding protein
LEQTVLVSEAAKMLDVTVDAVYKMIKRGDLHNVATGIKIRVSTEEIRAYH